MGRSYLDDSMFDPLNCDSQRIMKVLTSIVKTVRQKMEKKQDKK